jgi:hypothetical protein
VRKSDLLQHYYSFPSSSVTYDNALKFSSETSFGGVQGHLWSPSSALEFRTVVEGLMYAYHSSAVWYAASDAAVEGRWLVTAGPDIGVDMSDLIPWRGGEGGGGTGENCVAVMPGYAWSADVSCQGLAKYIIEYECTFGQRFNDQGTACIGM